MLVEYSNFLTPEESNYFISLFDKNLQEHQDDDIYKYYYKNLMSVDLQTNKFTNFDFKKVRVQLLDESIKQIEKPHGHVNPWSFVIFLNTEFEGGELIFNNKVYSPEIGKMLYFTGDEIHRVNNCIGDRYTLVGFMHNNPMKVKKTNNNLI